MAACVALAFLLTGTVGCSVTDLAARQTVGLLGRTTPAIEMESDVELVARATPAGLKQLEGFWLITGDARVTALLAQGFCGYGALVQDEWEAATLAGDDARAAELRVHGRNMLGRCARYAQELLPAPLDDLLDLEAVDDDEAAARLARAGRGDAGALYWLATAGATALGIAPDDLALVDLLPRLQLILERVIALDPDHQLGQARMTLAILYASLSAAVGGDPERGAELFAEARAVTGGRLLLVDVMHARVHDVTVRDEVGFERRLVEVLRTPPSVFPEQRLANEIAHRKARRYLKHRSRWF